MSGKQVKLAVPAIGFSHGDVARRVGLQTLAVGAVEVETDVGFSADWFR